MRSVRPGHDEFWKFLGPYGWSRGYVGPDDVAEQISRLAEDVLPQLG